MYTTITWEKNNWHKDPQYTNNYSILSITSSQPRRFLCPVWTVPCLVYIYKLNTQVHQTSFLHSIQSCQKWQCWHQMILKQQKKLPPVELNLMITGGKFFAAVKSFDANIAISGNFVLNVKNSTVLQNPSQLRTQPIFPRKRKA